MRPWTSAIGIVVSSLIGWLAPDCPRTAVSDSRRIPILAWLICFSSSFLCGLVDDETRYWLAILFLLWRIDAVCGGINGKAVHQLLNGKVFNFPKEVGCIFLHDGDGAT